METARTRTSIRFISWNRACPLIGEFKMFAVVQKLIYFVSTELWCPKAQLHILHRQAERRYNNLFVNTILWLTLILLELLCFLKVTAKKTRVVVNYQLTVFFSHACFYDTTRRTVRKYRNQKLRVLWTKKGLRRDKRKTLVRPSLTLDIFQHFIVNKGYRILHSRIVVWCVERYFVDLDQTQISRC